VFVTLFGAKGAHTARIHLKHANGDLFERAHTDTFVVRARDVGKLEKLRFVQKKVF
jgi:hypothetical protein